MRIVEGKRLAAEVRRIAERSATLEPAVERTARRIVRDVRRGGDGALRRYGQRWDGLAKGQSLRVGQEELKAALAGVTPEFRCALERAARNIRRFCQWQMPRSFMRPVEPGISIGQVVRPLESVGCYVPGGRYPLPSSLLMTVIPAQVAGVKNIAVASPRPARETLAAAALLGVENFYRVGGAQAIAALAYGTKTIARVDKIVGPGNAYVTAAKKLVAFDCAIDFLAGPTEVVVAADEGNPVFLAADLVAQAEHDPQAMSIFVTSNTALAREVAEEAKKQSAGNVIARQSLKKRGAILVAGSHEEALEIANAIAPEHLTVSRKDAGAIRNAGSIFLGDYSPQALGDYASGPNHVLPTGGVARFRGGLGVLDFVKVISVQEASREGLREIAPVVETLAEAEGLKAHAASVRARCAHA